MKNRLKAVLFIALCCVAATGWSQLLADPNDQIYRFLQLWEQEGYTQDLPSVRPYPLQVVRRALADVIAVGTAMDVEIAGDFLNYFEGSKFPVPVNVEVFHDSQGKNQDYQGLFGFGARSTATITKKISYSAMGRLMLEVTPDDKVYPKWTDDYESTIYTEARFTGQYKFEVGGVPLNSYGAFNGAFFFGSERLYAQVGLIRSSYGPFIKSPVLGPQAPLAGHFSATYRTNALTLSAVFIELDARLGVAPDGEIYGLKGAVDFFPSKHLVLHSIEFHPISRLELGVFQVAVVGARFSPIYLFPFTQYVQNYFGDWDNSYVGLTATLDLPLNIQFDLIAFVDDINLSKMLQLDFNSNNNRVALRTGLSWIAPLNIPNRIEVNYLMITPYTYTHYMRTLASYLQYTHQGEHLGSVLEPNSDQWSLRVFAMPLRWLQLEAWASRTRHGNGSDYGEGSVDGDGSIFDDGVLPDGTRTHTGPSSFLMQDVLEKDLQAGLTTSIQWSTGRIDASLAGGYTFELVQNKDLDPNAPDETNHFIHAGLTLSY